MALPILYDYPLAYNPAKPRLMLIEKGVSYTTRVINLFNGQSLSPAFLRVNPKGTVPTLVHGDRTITESLEIVRYVDSSLGDAPLGGHQVDRPFVEQWGNQVDAWDGNLFIAANSSESAKSILAKLSDFREKFARARLAENPDLAQAYESKLASMAAEGKRDEDSGAIAENDRCLNGLLDTAESKLAAAGPSSWLAGSAYSQADVLLTVVLFRITMAKLQGRYIDPRPAVLSYYARVQQRPSWNDAFGTALSGSGTAKLLLPALAKAWWAGITKRY